MQLVQINDTEFIYRDKIVSLTVSTYYKNHFIYIRMVDGSVYETDYFETNEEAINFIRERLS